MFRVAVGVRRRVRAIGQAAGAVSRLRIARMGAEALLPVHAQPTADSVVGVRVTALDDATIYLRPRSHDRQAFELAFVEGLHLPPSELTGPLGRVGVFGANIGLPLVDLATRYPTAHLLGVEPDPDNAVLARANLAALADRCEIVEAAVWHCDGELTLSWAHDAWGFNLAEAVDGQVPTSVVRAVAADRLLADFGGDQPIDYLLVNIESAWHGLLQHGAWTSSVNCIKIEIQDHYDEAVPMLEHLGFRARLERLPWGAFAIGIRDHAVPKVPITNPATSTA